MARYIDADALPIVTECCVDEAGFFAKFKVVHEDDIKNAPSVDAVEVVRCKDCAWYRDEARICVNSHCTKSYYGCRVRKDHFCSFGERRGEDDV